MIDSDIDAPPDAPLPQDLELGLVASGNGSGRITSSPAGIDCGSTCTASFEDGTLVTLTAEPDASSLFTGWGGACNGTSPVCEVTITDATSVTATFTLKTYTVTVSKAGAGAGTVAGNGLDCGATCSVVVDHGTAISLTATPVALNNFVGWGDACSGTGTCALTITDDTTISAVFALDELSLLVVKGGNGVGTITSSPAGINCPTDCTEIYTANQTVTLTPAPAGSSTFTGWSGACTGTGACVVTMNAAKTVTGTFTLRKYALDVTKTGSTGVGTVTSIPGGIACGGDCTEMYDHGSVIALTAAESTGSTFTGWSGGGCSGTGACNVTLTAATTVNAQFTLNTYTLTAATTGTGVGTVTATGISCPGDCTGTFNHGTVANVSQGAAVGSTFMGWSGACSGMGACAVTMNMAQTVTATFALNSYDLTVTTNAGGSVTGPQIGCPGDCTGTFAHGTNVSLTAVPDPGYSFTSWGGACSGNAGCIVPMTMTQSVTATFTIKSYVLTAATAGTGTGTVMATGISCPGDCTETFIHGTVVPVTQTPDPSSNFTGWSGGTCSGTGPCSVTMTDLKSVTANYTLKTYNLDVTIAGTGTVTAPQITCPGDCVGTYSHGNTVSLTQSAGANFQFTGWSGGGCTGTGACTVTMNGAQSVTATFTPLYTLTVVKAGAGTGNVTSNPGTISCGTNGTACSQAFLDTTMVALTATPTGGSTFSGWTGVPAVAACTTAPTCTVTMGQARTMTATFAPPNFTLTVATAGDGFGSVTSSPGGISCPGTCTKDYVQSTVVTLTAAPVVTLAAQASLFSGWSGACSGTGTTCTVTMSQAQTVTATFALAPNVMFVTSAQPSIDTLASGAGWLANADAICNAAATQSTRAILGNGPHQNSKYIAWISGVDQNGVHNVGSRLTNTAGWERVDRRPFLYKTTDIKNNDIVYPPRIDENGNDVGTVVLTWTGTDQNGNYSGLACENPLNGMSWGTPNARGSQGLASANSLQFTDMFGTVFGGNQFNDSCSGQRRLYCFGTDRAAKITVTRQAGRLAFTSSGTFQASAAGIGAADTLCKMEAAAANLPSANTFLALVAPQGGTAIGRFAVDPQNKPWVRVGDQQPLTKTEADMRSINLVTLESAPNVLANGQRIGNVPIWTGADHPASIGSSADTCSDWLQVSTKATGGFAFDTGVTQIWFGGNNNTLGCVERRPVVCMQNLQ